jgi:hypothetical protein
VEEGSGEVERAARGQAGEAERGLWVAWIEACEVLEGVAMGKGEERKDIRLILRRTSGVRCR